MSEDFVLLEGWATSLALKTARELATANVVDVDALVLAGRLPEKLRSWLEDVLVSLERSGLSHRDQLGRHIDPDAQMPSPDEILRTVAHEHQNLSAELLVATSTATAIRAIEAGQGEALTRSLSAKVLDGFELGSSRVQAASLYLSTLLRRSTRTWPKDRALRLLQIGFGPLTSGDAEARRLHAGAPYDSRSRSATVGTRPASPSPTEATSISSIRRRT